MRQKIWYYSLRAYLQLAFIGYYKKLNVIGRKNIPKNTSVVFLANHENAFLDALLLAVTTTRFTHYLTRSDVFTKPLFRWLLSTVNMRPIYRIRDGKDALAKNDKVFGDCIEYLHKKQAVMIFPEGTHQLQPQLRKISKGFTRIVFGALEKHPEMKLVLIPVGINYSDHFNFGSKASIHYGKPIDARQYYNTQNEKEATQKLRDEVECEMKKLVTHIDHSEDYDMLYAKLKKANVDFSDIRQTHKMLGEMRVGKIPEKTALPKPALFDRLLYPLVYINNIILVLIWKKLKPMFKDPAFYGSIKFSLGAFVLPVIYLLQTSVVWIFAGPFWALLYLFFSIITVHILAIGQSKKDLMVPREF